MTISPSLQKELQNIGCEIRLKEPMSRHTTFQIGGPAALMVFPQDTAQLQRIVTLCRGQGVKPLILGKGSNMLCRDEGIDTVVVHIGSMFHAMEVVGESVIRCQAGVPLTQLCTFAWRGALSGLEFAYGIPGNVGGAVYMNAGAYGGEMKDVVKRVIHIRSDGRLETLEGKDLGFAYRKSVYQQNGCVILSVDFALEKGDPALIREKMDDLMSRRVSKQPLEYPSAGSVFKRPVGYFAGTLIEQCGLKGASVGGAAVSEKHAGFIINKGGATCRDVLALIKLIQNTVYEKTGVRLECEIKAI